jgi:hypothetical protein
MNDLEGPLNYFSTFAYTGEFMTWFGYISRLVFQWGERAYFTRSIYFYLPSLCLEGGGGG